jgi:hypothetical protein
MLTIHPTDFKSLGLWPSLVLRATLCKRKRSSGNDPMILMMHGSIMGIVVGVRADESRAVCLQICIHIEHVSNRVRSW